MISFDILSAAKDEYFGCMSTGVPLRRVVHTDLDYLAGTWSAEDAAEFERNTAAFETVDEAMWK